MKTPWENESFCAESFGDDLPNELKEATVASMVRAARESRRQRILGRGLVAVGLIVGGLLILRPSPHSVEQTRISAPKSEIFQMVRTEALGGDIVVHTVRIENLSVQTEVQGAYDILTDDQILEIFRDRGVALVKMGDRTELQFLDSNGVGL